MLKALWSPLDGILGALKGSWGVLVTGQQKYVKDSISGLLCFSCLIGFVLRSRQLRILWSHIPI